MSEIDAPDPDDLVRRILDENRTMTVATVRADGWPQATIVGYVHEGLTLYFAVARTSQKLSNIRRDPRISIALGHKTEAEGRARGLSMAAQAVEVTEVGEIRRLNDLIRSRYAEAEVFAPREANAAVVRADPLIVSLVDDRLGLAEPREFRVSKTTTLSAPKPG